MRIAILSEGTDICVHVPLDDGVQTRGFEASIYERVVHEARS